MGRKVVMLVVSLLLSLVPIAQTHAHVFDFDLPALAEAFIGESFHHADILPHASRGELVALIGSKDSTTGEEKEKEEEEKYRGIAEAHPAFSTFRKLPVENKVDENSLTSKPCHRAFLRLYLWYAFSEAP
ncbi:hypothetical protein FHS56_001310 [Thermonema lapsum]|uniref:Uncharacterized protein n=1 Tax=Thermonema lapsum TaxID=28195 RepID=A0A846MRA5_9BACT|nr:hypothetical protein [Thermonema lapsum]NIK73797.1 hypothetical protein [Thermonema lapsum]